MRMVRHPAAHAITLTLGGIGTARVRRIALAVAQRFGATPVCNPRLTLQVVYTPCDSHTIAAALAALDLRIPPIRLFVVDIAALHSPGDPSHLRLTCATGPSAPLLDLRRSRRSGEGGWDRRDRKSTRLNSSHSQNSYAVFCLKKKKKKNDTS